MGDLTKAQIYRIRADKIGPEHAEALNRVARVVLMNEQLCLPDDRPLSECIPGIWPKWGEFKLVVQAALAAIEREGEK